MSTTLEITSYAGLTPTARLFPEGSDTEVASVQGAEATNRKGLYQFTLDGGDENLTGLHSVTLETDEGDFLDEYWVDLPGDGYAVRAELSKALASQVVLDSIGGATIVTPVVGQPIERTKRTADVPLYVGEVVETLILFEDGGRHPADLSGYDDLTLTIQAVQSSTKYTIENDSLNRTNDSEGLIGFTNPPEITDLTVTGTPDPARPLMVYPFALRHTSTKALIGQGKILVYYAPGT